MTPFWNCLPFLSIGLTVSLAVLSVGPMVTFGFLLIPPLISHLLARNIWQFILFAPAIGALPALIGFCLVLLWELPVGPTDVALLGVFYWVAVLLKKAISFLSRLSPARISHSTPPGEGKG